MKISVIISTYNEERDVGNCINSLKKQSYKNFEIIVVDDGSNDGTIEIVKNFQKKDDKIRLIKGKHKGPGFSRNIGAKASKGEILVFVDADMTFEKYYIKNLIEPIIKNKEIIGTTHELEIVKNTDNVWSKCWGKVRVSKEEAKNVKVFRAIRKGKFLELGGFDPKYGYADDQTFWFKYKIKPIVAKNTICYHQNPETLKQVYRQSRWIGASLNNFFINNKIIKCFVPFFMIIVSPLAIPILSIRKCKKNKDFKIFFPWMFVFMTVRYFGAINGVFNKIYKDINVR
ncbi:MAG: glycosyltransferase family A protein [Candidatus Pacearchaeota archaeon]